MKNTLWIRQNEVSEIRALWDEAFIFRALSHFFRAKSIQPLLQKMARTHMNNVLNYCA